MDINSLPFVRSSFTVRRAQGALPESEQTTNVPFQNYESSNDRCSSAVSSAQELGGVWRVTVHRQSQLKSSNCSANCELDSPNKLPAPSKLKKRHSESEGSTPRAKKKSKRMDIRDHLAQLKRKQLHFDLNDICVDSSSDPVEPQQVPGSPKLPVWTTHYGDDTTTLAPYGEAVLDGECATNQSWECDSSLSYGDAVEVDHGCGLSYGDAVEVDHGCGLSYGDAVEVDHGCGLSYGDAVEVDHGCGLSYGDAVEVDHGCGLSYGDAVEVDHGCGLSYGDAVEVDHGCGRCDQHQEDIYQPGLQLAPTESSFCTLPHTSRLVHEEENFAEVPTLHNHTITTTGLRMPAFDNFMASAEPCRVDVSSFSIINYYPREE